MVTSQLKMSHRRITDISLYSHFLSIYNDTVINNQIKLKLYSYIFNKLTPTPPFIRCLYVEPTSSLSGTLTDLANGRCAFKRSLLGHGNIISIDLEPTQCLLIKELEELKR